MRHLRHIPYSLKYAPARLTCRRAAAAARPSPTAPAPRAGAAAHQRRRRCPRRRRQRWQRQTQLRRLCQPERGSGRCRRAAPAQQSCPVPPLRLTALQLRHTRPSTSHRQLVSVEHEQAEHWSCNSAFALSRCTASSLGAEANTRAAPDATARSRCAEAPELRRASRRANDV